VTVAVLLEPEFRTSSMWEQALTAALPEEEILLLAPNPAGESDQGQNAGVDVAIVRGVDPGNLHRFVNLQFVQCMWAGVDKLLNDPAVPAIVPLARTVDPAMADQMAATALAHVLDIALHHQWYRSNQRAGVWEPHHAKPMSSKTIAILGFGSLGRRCAEYLAFTGAKIVGLRSSRSTAATHHPWTTTASLHEAVAEADVIVNLLPLTGETIGVLNAELFAACRPGAAVINLGRGQHLDETDLVAALDSGQLGRAVLDVFATEPLPPSHPFWNHEKITVTPHVAAETDPHTAAALIAANIRSFRAGQLDRITGLVDRAKGY
jgi:glyoxylate/hydroxypyruvate reductase